MTDTIPRSGLMAFHRSAVSRRSWPLIARLLLLGAGLVWALNFAAPATARTHRHPVGFRRAAHALEGPHWIASWAASPQWTRSSCTCATRPDTAVAGGDQSLERSLGEVKRRTKVIGRFPGARMSRLTLVWAVLDLLITHETNGIHFTQLDRQRLNRIRYQDDTDSTTPEEVTAA